MAMVGDGGIGERLQELEALRSIFAEEELEVEDPDFLDPSLVVEVALRDLHLSICVGSPPARFRVLLPPDYPEQALPELRLEASGATKAELELVLGSLRAAAAERRGEVCIYDLCIMLQEELLPAAPWLQGGKAIGTGDDAAGSPGDLREVAQETADGETSVAVLRIDHMNDAGAYCKKLREWARQGGISGALFFRIPEKSGRWEDVYLFLTGGCDDSLSSFVNNLRTQHVDKNSRGLKCKERKSDILYRGALQSPAEGSSWPWEGLPVAIAAGPARAAVLPDWEYTSDAAARVALGASLQFLGLDCVASISAVVVEASKAGGVGGSPARDCTKGSGCFLTVAVRPNAKTGSHVTNVQDLRHGLASCVRADVAAAPKEGEANRELCALLAGALGVSKGSVSVARGATSKDKEVFVEGLRAQEALARLTGVSKA